MCQTEEKRTMERICVLEFGKAWTWAFVSIAFVGMRLGAASTEGANLRWPKDPLVAP